MSTGDTVFQFGCLTLNLPIEQARAAAGELAQLLPGGAVSSDDKGESDAIDIYFYVLCGRTR